MTLFFGFHAISPVLMLILDIFLYFGYNYTIKVGARLGRTIFSAHGGLSKIGSGRGPKIDFLAIGGRGGLKWLVQVEQIVVHIGTQVGGLLWTQNSSEKCTQRCRNGPKTANFWPKMPFSAIGGRGGLKWLVQVEQMVVNIETHAGGLFWTQNSSEKFLSEISLIVK